MPGLTVLITNHTLSGRTGTEIVVRDLALGLLRRGHQPIVYTTQLGPIADELLAHTVPVVTDLAMVTSTPDAIHGHHAFETSLAMLRFPGVPAVFTCHDWSSWFDEPPRTPLVRQYLAVDETCRDRLVMREGIPADAVRLLQNAVDLERFVPRGPLPHTPRRALIFSNYAREDNVVPIVRAGCEVAGLPLDVVGGGVGQLCTDPEQVIGRYDIVFGKARCALEAMAVGAAVVLCDAAGFAGMVTKNNLEELRLLNFGRRALVGTPVTVQRVIAAVRNYDALDATAVSRRIRAVAGLDLWLDELVGIYHQLFQTPASASECAALLTFASDMVARALQQFTHHVIDREVMHRGMRALQEDLDRARAEAQNSELMRQDLDRARAEAQNSAQMRQDLDRARAEALDNVVQMRQDLDRVRAEAHNCAILQQELQRTRAKAEALGLELQLLRNATVVRLRERVAQLPVVGRSLRSLVKCVRRVCQKR